ncbi:hypothetical protein K1719_032373 [Acacia pycnantha]|nr:hypothetical protein K1719_032373 [Acacia pycnantha]
MLGFEFKIYKFPLCGNFQVRWISETEPKIHSPRVDSPSPRNNYRMEKSSAISFNNPLAQRDSNCRHLLNPNPKRPNLRRGTKIPRKSNQIFKNEIEKLSRLILKPLTLPTMILHFNTVRSLVNKLSDDIIILALFL